MNQSTSQGTDDLFLAADMLTAEGRRQEFSQSKDTNIPVLSTVQARLTTANVPNTNLTAGSIDNSLQANKR